VPGISAAFALMIVAGALAGCDLPSSSAVSLHYEPSAPLPVRPADNVVGMGPVIDARPAMPPDQLGTAADKFGWQELTLTSEGPVARAVREAFIDALMARGLLAPPGEFPYELTVRILQLQARQAWRERAVAEFALDLRRGRHDRLHPGGGRGRTAARGDGQGDRRGARQAGLSGRDQPPPGGAPGREASAGAAMT
jgi:hypothetical protein